MGYPPLRPLRAVYRRRHRGGDRQLQRQRRGRLADRAAGRHRRMHRRHVLHELLRHIRVHGRGAQRCQVDADPDHHPVQPAPQDIIEKAKEVMEKYGYEYLFLATEDQRIYDLFKIHFGEKLLFNDQKLLDSTHGVNYISELDSKKGLSGKQDVLNYLTTLFILSKCSSFIGGCTSGTLGAYMMSEHFEYEYFWNLGLYK